MRLTQREKEILQSAKEGLSIKMTASKLGISKSTVKNARQNIYAKFGCNSILGAIAVHENLQSYA